MLEAVQEVHSHHIVHADLKPSNFLLVGCQLKVIDFGLAVQMLPGSDYVLRKQMSGTRDYMAPETLAGYVIENGVMNRAAMRDISGVRVSTKSDVWALGIILYQVVFGMLPFATVPGGRLAKIACLIDLDQPVEFELAMATDLLDPLLLDTMRRCLAKRPEDRATVEQLLRHPYLRPSLGAAAVARSEAALGLSGQLCPSCKTRHREMARLSKRRLKVYNLI
jgi:serine/threonine protein kinase